jgi:hypothetical protein
LFSPLEKGISRAYSSPSSPTPLVESDISIAKVLLIFLFASLESNYKFEIILPIEDFSDPLYLWVSST